MPSLLQIEVSPGGDQSVSRKISAEFVAAWKQAHADGTVILRDLVTDPVPHLDAEALFAGYTPEDLRSEGMFAKHQYRQDLIEEITGVDEILISTPMWNWSVPSVLKAYFDQIIITGQLDGSGADGLKGKKVTFVVSQGGSYREGTRRHGWDFETGYLNLVATALGSTDVEIIHAEFTLAGIAPGMESLVQMKEESITAAIAAAKMRGGELTRK